MRLPTINLDLETQLKEFDIWITPSLGEIQDTERFKKVMDNVVEIFESLATATNNFNFRIEDWELEVLEAYCKAAGRTKTEIIRELIRGLKTKKKPS